MLKRKFAEDFNDAVRRHAEGLSKLRSDQVALILEDMGFLCSLHQNFDKKNESELFFDLWTLLRGERNSGVTLRNLKAFLEIICGLKTKRQPGQKQPVNSDQIWRGEDLNISSKQTQLELQKHFGVLSHNRTERFLNRKHLSDKKKHFKPTFRPEILKKSVEMTRELHQKLSEHNIPHHEFLLFKGREAEA